MLQLLALHLVLACTAPALVRVLRRRAFLVLALGPGVTTGWAATHVGDVLDGRPVEQVTSWVPGLDLTLDLRLDPLALLLVALVAGVGTLVFVYCAWYFPDDEPRLGLFGGVLTAFAGAMLALVLADDLLLLYVGWELTTVTSFLLIGHDDLQRTSRRAATQALLVTTAGGLLMLLGLIMLGQQGGTYRLSALLADPPRGPLVTGALLLVLLGAFTKSAQAPFHPWLPAAMAAPTPVSAYLHAAAMVKAGVYLIARLAPAFADVGPWRPVVLSVGLTTMLLGGWRALRQHDLKRLLAFGTVSQLGFLVVLFGAGTRDAAVAAAGVLLAHGLFKAALFLSVGVIDHETGTRDLRELSGLGRRMPVFATMATLAAASMAAVPPLLGFVAKESAYAAFATGNLTDTVVLVGLVAGSVLTVAYSARFVWGAFARKVTVDAACVDAASHPAVGFVAPVAVLGLASLALGIAPGVADPLAQVYADGYRGEVEHLALWHGLTFPLALSGLTLLLGGSMFLARRPVNQAQAALPVVADADSGYGRTLHALNRTAFRLTGALQSGSLPIYLTTILLTLVALPGIALLLRAPAPDRLELWENPMQGVVAVAVLAAALATAQARRRLTAVLLLGAVGYGVAVLFVIQGAPDLALTQLLMETLTLVVFVFVLRRLPQTFSRRPFRGEQLLRSLVAIAVGGFVTAFVLVAANARTSPPVSGEFIARAEPEAGGKNIVNVILVDFRGFDTLGEITVLLVAAMGVAALVLAGRQMRTEPGPKDRSGVRRVRPSLAAQPRRDASDGDGEHRDAAAPLAGSVSRTPR